MSDFYDGVWDCDPWRTDDPPVTTLRIERLPDGKWQWQMWNEWYLYGRKDREELYLEGEPMDTYDEALAAGDAAFGG